MAFCRRVMHNLVIDQSRARSRRPAELALFDAFDSRDPRAGDPLKAVELRPTLLAALNTLTPQQRAIVVPTTIIPRCGWIDLRRRDRARLAG